MTARHATIRLVGESMDDSVYSVGVAEEVDVGDDAFALTFSEPLPGDDEGYCVIAEPGQRTEYRAVETCEIAGSAMRLVLTQAADVLALPRELVLELDVSEVDVARLESGLRRVGVPLTAVR